jgi:hypothetical protein
MPMGGRIWCAKPNIERSALDIGGTCVYPPANNGVAMRGAVEAQVAGLGWPGARLPMGGRVWRAKLNIEHIALNIGRTCRKLPADGSGSLWDMGEVPLEGLEGLEPNMCRGGC